MPITRAYAQAAEPGNFFVAGKNKIINGDFRINQRAFSSSANPANGTYSFDRWNMQCSNSPGTATYSTQTFTAGTAPVAGYEGINFARIVTASQANAGEYAAFTQPIEDVRTFANQTITVSFWAKAGSGTPNVGICAQQNFGSGGSASVQNSPAVQAITTSWARYSFTVSVPSISGKTIGTGSALIIWLVSSAGTTISGAGYPAVGIQNATIDFWGVQVEAGSVATPFTTATGTLAGELAACQRYAVKIGGNANYNQIGCGNFNSGGTVARAIINLPVEMRTAPSSITSASLRAHDTSSGFTMSSVALDTASSKTVAFISGTVSGATAFRFCFIDGDTGAGYVILSAEL